MSHIAAYPQTHRFWGLISAVLFILTIPLGNWVVMNVGLVCLKDGPCLVPVLPGLMAPSAVLLAGLALVLRDAVHHCLGTRWAFYCILAGTALSGFLSDASLVISLSTRRCAGVFRPGRLSRRALPEALSIRFSSSRLPSGLWTTLQGR